MTQLERAVAGSGHTAFSMKFRPGFPADILSGANPFSDGSRIKFGDIVHPDDYRPFCEVINEIVNGDGREFHVHSRLSTNGNYVWYYITGTAETDENGRLEDICGLMFNVSGYLDCDTEDAVLRRFRSKHTVQLSDKQQELTLRDILGDDYLFRIQKPFAKTDGLLSAIIDSGGKIICANKNDKYVNLNKMNYQRKQTIRVRHKDVASWVIAANTEELVNGNAQLLETMTQTVSGIANSYVVIVDEMENSQNANKLLGQNFEDQILVNNIYSLILESAGTKAAMAGMIPLISEYFELSDMLFGRNSETQAKVYTWDTSGMLLPIVSVIPKHKSIADELDCYGYACADLDTLYPDHEGANKSCIMIRTYENGKTDGAVIYIAKTDTKTWSNRELKLIKSITHILSTIINKIFMEDELATSRARLERIAYYDSATGIPNRSMFERDFSVEVSSGCSGAVIAVEVSNLKQISEIYGCGYADEVLQSLAEYISAVPCDAKKSIYRFSNDILFITLRGAGHESARRFAQTILDKFRKPWYVDENEQRLQVYAGITLYPSDAADIGHCISAVTQTLRLAKEQKLETAECYSVGLEEQLNNSKLVKKLISESAANGFKGFYYLYQPVVDINTGALHCCEATLCWQNEELTVPRDQFLPIINQLGLSKELYRYCVNRCCEFCAAVRDAGVEHFRVSISVPENILSTDTAVEVLRSTLLEHSLPPGALSIAISEREGTLYHGNMFLQQLAKIGVNIIADDLGESYFSISPLENPAVKTIKIRSSRFKEDPVSAAYMQSVIRLAHEKNITVCAKCVDSSAIFRNVRKFNVDLVEGVFNGRPLHTKEFIEKLVTNSAVRESVR